MGFYCRRWSTPVGIASRNRVCASAYHSIISDHLMMTPEHWSECARSPQPHVHSHVIWYDLSCVSMCLSLKNENSLLSQVLRFFSSKSRLLITGTPLQVLWTSAWMSCSELAANMGSSWWHVYGHVHASSLRTSRACVRFPFPVPVPFRVSPCRITYTNCGRC